MPSVRLRTRRRHPARLARGTRGPRWPTMPDSRSRRRAHAASRRRIREHRRAIRGEGPGVAHRFGPQVAESTRLRDGRWPMPSRATCRPESFPPRQSLDPPPAPRGPLEKRSAATAGIRAVPSRRRPPRFRDPRPPAAPYATSADTTDPRRKPRSFRCRIAEEWIPGFERT